MDIAVGIDLGTTNSAIAYVNDRGIPVMIPNDFGSPVTPSVICVKDGEIIVGEVAKEFQAAGEQDVAAFFKQQMGERNFVFYAGGREFSAVDLSALVLEKLKRDAETALGQSIANAVITVPAYFKNPQREDTIAAGEKAGLNVLQIINEPTAAAIAYGIRHASKDQTLMFYDLGGGTFDVTILEIANGEIRIKTSDGDNELGGKNWDYRIVEFVASQFESEHGIEPLEDSESLADLLVRIEETKKQLSVRERATLSLTHEGMQGRYELTREHFEDITADLMERTISLTRKALADAKVDPKDVDGVLLVGGSTRMPMVKDFVVRTFGKQPLSGVNVDEAVALGAAIKASEWSEEQQERISKFAIGGAIKSVDVTNHSLGMIAINQDGSAYINAVILPKNAELPCVESRPFKHRFSKLEIFLTQGETESPADPAYLGKYVVTDIPREAEVLDIEYSYDISGTVKVAAKVQATGQELPVTVEPLSPDVPGRFLVLPEQSKLGGHITVYLAFDLSGSMSGSPLEEAKKAAKGFLANVDLGCFSVGIMGVSDRTKIYLKACQNAKQIESAIQSLSVGDTGGGNSADPFLEVKSELEYVTGQRCAIVLADGVWSYQDKAIQRAKACHRAGIDIIGVGFGGADREFLKAISSTEDVSFFTGLDGLVETFTTIAQVLTESGGSSMMMNPSESSDTGSKKSFLGRLRKKS